MAQNLTKIILGKAGAKGWQVIPCQGWNILDVNIIFGIQFTIFLGILYPI
jgi:hypothetical protein